VYNPFLIFVLGAMSGLGVTLFAALAFWMHRKDASQTPYKQFRTHYFFAKGAVWAGFTSVGCAIIAIVGAVDSTFALPHLEWPAGVLIGVALPLGLQRWLRRGPSQESRRRSSQ
jgi:hypothetical protein